MLDVLLPCVLLALVVAALRAAPHWHWGAPRRGGAKLPAPATYRLGLSPRSAWIVERHGLTVCTSTAALNAVPKRVLAALSPTARSALRRFYDAGVLVGAAGGAAAFVGAVWALTRAWRAVWDEAEAHARVVRASATQQPAGIVRRAFGVAEQATAPPSLHSADGGLQPLIPGVTTPLSHLPTLMLALVLAQLIHEAGHALAAALDDLAPSKLQFSVHAIIPSASVVFPSSVDFLPVRARARIATAGPWHNLLLCGGLLTLGVFSPILWADYSDYGRVVSSISAGSGLRNSLRVGDVITHVDDVFVGGSGDAWTTYLSGTDDSSAGSGWCVSLSDFQDTPAAPCEQRHLVAFVQASDEGDGSAGAHCLAPHAVFAEPAGKNCACPMSATCVRPAPGENILRLRVRSGKRTETVLWSGDWAAVLHQVQVDTAAPRLLGGMTRWGALFMAYFRMVSLSLFLFNLLPLPGTDGIALFSALVSSSGKLRDRPARQLTAQPASRHPTINPYRYDSGSDDDDEYRYGSHEWGSTAHGRREEVWQRRLRRSVEGVTAAVVVGWLLGWAMLALLRSS